MINEHVDLDKKEFSTRDVQELLADMRKTKGAEVRYIDQPIYYPPPPAPAAPTREPFPVWGFLAGGASLMIALMSLIYALTVNPMKSQLDTLQAAKDNTAILIEKNANNVSGTLEKVLRVEEQLKIYEKDRVTTSQLQELKSGIENTINYRIDGATQKFENRISLLEARTTQLLTVTTPR